MNSFQTKTSPIHSFPHMTCGKELAEPVNLPQKTKLLKAI